MLTSSDLVLCPGTVRDATFEEIAAAAAGSGCAGMSVRPQAAADAIGRLGSAAAVRRFLEDTQVEIADFDALVDWDYDPVVVPDFISRGGPFEQQAVFDLAASLGARSINLVELTGSVEAEQLAEPFARACERAKALGLLVHIEFFQGSAIKDLAAAAEIVGQADMPNGGIVLDTFHYHRGPADPDNQLERHASLISMLQVSDAAPLPSEDVWEEITGGRLLPGSGAIGLVNLMTRLRDAGVDAPIGIEVFSKELHERAPAEAAKLAADAMRSVIARMPD
ncbi:MAG: sugar phosphate isomerase/epimerase [Sphingomonadaceae bacterium]|nr:sugar phosphate isomerase/epimerase [Sphingomonadaceae bacterium]